MKNLAPKGLKCLILFLPRWQGDLLPTTTADPAATVGPPSIHPSAGGVVVEPGSRSATGTPNMLNRHRPSHGEISLGWYHLFTITSVDKAFTAT